MPQETHDRQNLEILETRKRSAGNEEICITGRREIRTRSRCGYLLGEIKSASARVRGENTVHLDDVSKSACKEQSKGANDPKRGTYREQYPLIGVKGRPARQGLNALYRGEREGKKKKSIFAAVFVSKEKRSF